MISLTLVQFYTTTLHEHSHSCSIWLICILFYWNNSYRWVSESIDTEDSIMRRKMLCQSHRIISTTVWQYSITLWYNIIVWQYNIMTLLFRYDNSVSNTLTLSENSSQEGSETCFLSDQSWTIIKDIWSLYMHIYWPHHDYTAYDTLFTLLWCFAVDHSLTSFSELVICWQLQWFSQC